MIGCLQTRVHKQPIIPLYFEFENKLKFITSRPVVLLIYYCSLLEPNFHKGLEYEEYKFLRDNLFVVAPIVL